ncbi:MAG: SDR family oxidoreductase [Saprospiraceae bacterium]|nr:SDR family oxidoreductase [Saprospiraceae bacterium]
MQGKVAVVTGGSGVLCSQMSKALAARGVKVAVLGRSPEKTQAVVDEIIKTGGQAIPILADVLNRDALEAANETVLSTWGQIDILVNGAGGNVPGGVVAPSESFFVDHRIEHFQEVLNINLHGSVLPSMVFGRSMAQQKSGVIINISSMTATRAITRVAGYAAAKAAIEAFTRWLAVETALKLGANIRVNAIAPGFFITEQNRSLLTNPDGSYTERGNAVIRNTPMGRFGSPDELAGACIWLCSDASRFVTGAVIPVDGGFSSWSGG